MVKWLFLICLLPSIALAQRRNVTVVYLEHPDSSLLQLNKAEAKIAVQGTNKLFRQLGMRIQIRNLRFDQDPAPHITGLSPESRVYKISYLTSWGQKYRGRADAVHYMVAPLDGGYMAGVARATCSNNTRLAHSLSNVKTGRVDTAIVTMAHEIAHTFGAGHWDMQPNVMHSNALSYLPWSAGWINWVTRGDISFCQRVIKRE
jgi:hypothetical protein